jgi:hypothetical protein
MNNHDNHQEKKPQERFEEFCKRLGIRMNKRSSGGTGVRGLPWWEPFAQEAEESLQRLRTARSFQRPAANRLWPCNRRRRVVVRRVPIFASGNSFHNHRQLRVLHVGLGRE